MAFGRRCRSNANHTNQNLGLAFVRNTRSMSGKRIALLSNTEVVKKHCSEKMIQNHEKSLIESLPLDILIKKCGCVTRGSGGAVHRAVLPSVVRSCFRWPGCVTQNVDCAVLVKLIWARFCLQIRILCGVDHGDLKRLFNVSKMFREATLVARKWHFAYNTPVKTSVFKSSTD
ncbi:hypothetical protein RHMOL_Rhmol10G0307100 [Rhododendron molle]|uniref:Uncharacterized protein n=1 Tax=Rhododendron molle TaxID=49168 RepID=A0ACC0M907_RHOML|nr:hypothetical protein RHMOL_Rhmol10G0307100 [Rhododendron molle]